MIRRFFIVFLLLIFISLADCLAQSIVTGKVVGEYGDSIVSASVVLLKGDTIVTGGITDDAGDFIINNVAIDEYMLRVSMIGFLEYVTDIKIENDNDSINLGQIKMNTDPNVLDDVVVMSDLRKSDAEKDVIRLSKDIIKNSYNAVDAIAKLPKFDKSKGQLTSIDGSILIVINDRVATSDELAMIKPENIKKINHYHKPPLQYARYGKDVVIEVYTHNPVDPFLMAGFTSGESLNCISGRERVDVQYVDSLNSVSVWYQNYRNAFHRLEGLDEYSYLDGDKWNTNRYEYENGRMKYMSHNAAVQYAYQDVKYMFAANLNFGYGRHDVDLLSDVTIVDVLSPDIRRNKVMSKSESEEHVVNELHGTNKDNRYSMNRNGVLDLYFQYKVNKNEFFALNVTNTLSQSEYEQIVVRQMEEGSDPSRSYVNFTDVNNGLYVITTDARYIGRLWNGEYTAGVLHTYRRFMQQYNEDDRDNDTHNLQAYVSYNKSFNDKVGFYVAADIKDNIYFLNGKSRNAIMPSVFYNINYNATKLFSLRHGCSFDFYAVNASQLTAAKSFIDERFYSLSNPDLKDNYGLNVSLSPIIATPDGKLYFHTNLSFSYHNGMIRNKYFKGDDGIVYRQSVNAGDFYLWAADVYLQHRPVRWLSYKIGGDVSYGNVEIEKKMFDYLDFSEWTAVDFYLDQFSFGISLSNPISGWFKNIKRTEYAYLNQDPSFRAYVDWTHNDFNISLMYTYDRNLRYKETRLDNMSYFVNKGYSTNKDINSSGLPSIFIPLYKR